MRENEPVDYQADIGHDDEVYGVDDTNFARWYLAIAFISGLVLVGTYVYLAK